MTSSPADKGTGEQPILVSPIPDDAPPVPQDFPYNDTAGWHYFPVDHYSVFKDTDGKILRYVCRIEKGPGGNKITPPLTLWQHQDGDSSRLQWHFKGSPPLRTFWNLDRITARPTDLVILVEGELKAEYLQKLLDTRADNKITVITAQGGTSANKTTDWTPLVGRQVLCWRDNDAPSSEYMNLVTAILQGLSCKVMHLNIIDKPNNWDCKDAILIDKWDRQKVIEFINANKIPAPDFNYDDELPPDESPPPEQHEGPIVPPFRCLGFQSGVYFILPHAARQVLTISAGSLPGYLLSLAPLRWYEVNFPGKKQPEFRSVQDYIIRSCEAAGPYNPDALRGVGAWTEDEHVILHVGNHLIVDGKETDFNDHKTPYIYETSFPLKNAIKSPPLSMVEAHLLLEFMTSLSWDSDLAARYVAGWTVLAPVCGALEWRPNIWITGGSGTGKTSVIKHIMKPCVGPFCKNVSGGTTSAGIRNKLRCAALSIISDEAEAEDVHAQQSIQSILELARVASSGDDTILKGSQDQKGVEFLIRSMFCLSSIGVNADKQADKTRFTVCQLRHGGMGKQEWNTYLKKIHETITPDWAARLRARTVAMLPTIKKNAETFSLAISELVSSSRAGDQHGTLLAGCYSLTSDKVISFETAREWVLKKDWAEVKEAHDSGDEKSCCDTIMQSTIRAKGSDISIAELVAEVAKSDADLPAEDAKNALARSGIKIEGSPDNALRVVIADSHPIIRHLLGETAWWKTYGRILKRISGAEPRGVSKFHGICCRATSLPWTAVFRQDEEPLAPESDNP